MPHALAMFELGSGAQSLPAGFFLHSGNLVQISQQATGQWYATNIPLQVRDTGDSYLAATAFASDTAKGGWTFCIFYVDTQRSVQMMVGPDSEGNWPTAPTCVFQAATGASGTRVCEFSPLVATGSAPDDQQVYFLQIDPNDGDSLFYLARFTTDNGTTWTQNGLWEAKPNYPQWWSALLAADGNEYAFWTHASPTVNVLQAVSSSGPAPWGQPVTLDVESPGPSSAVVVHGQAQVFVAARGGICQVVNTGTAWQPTTIEISQHVGRQYPVVALGAATSDLQPAVLFVQSTDDQRDPQAGHLFHVRCDPQGAWHPPEDVTPAPTGASPGPANKSVPATQIVATRRTPIGQYVYYFGADGNLWQLMHLTKGWDATKIWQNP